MYTSNISVLYYLPNLSIISFIPLLIFGIWAWTAVTLFHCNLVLFLTWLIFWSHLAAILAFLSLFKCKSSQWFCHVSSNSEPASNWFLVGWTPEYCSDGANCLTLKQKQNLNNLKKSVNFKLKMDKPGWYLFLKG